MNRIELIDENGFAPEGFLALAEQVAQACAEEEGVGAFCVALTLFNTCCYTLFVEQSITHANACRKSSNDKDNSDDQIHTVHYLLFVNN